MSSWFTPDYIPAPVKFKPNDTEQLHNVKLCILLHSLGAYDPLQHCAPQHLRTQEQTLQSASPPQNDKVFIFSPLHTSLRYLEGLRMQSWAGL